MPKVVVYVRAEDARVIEATEGRAIEQWVRSLVRDEVAKWHKRKSGVTGEVVYLSFPDEEGA
jgi:hypothetical protein